jgi:hypothetical protein
MYLRKHHSTSPGKFHAHSHPASRGWRDASPGFAWAGSVNPICEITVFKHHFMEMLFLTSPGKIQQLTRNGKNSFQIKK